MESSPLVEEKSGESRGSWPNLHCSRSMAFRNERRHLIILSVLAGIVFFGCGLLGGTASRYSPPASPNTGSFSASTPQVDPSVSGLGGEASAEAYQQQMDFAAVVDGGEMAELKVHMFNSYTKDNPIDLYPWEHMAEPYKPSTMELLGWPQSGDNLEYR